MWLVVKLLKDDSIHYVPKIWYHSKKKMCAFPIAKNFTKKLIEKMTPLNMFEHNWLPVMKIGPLYGSLEEARTKMYCATMLSNKLVNCEQLSTNVTRKTLENEILQSPCIVKSRSSEEDRTKTNEDCILSHSSANNKVDIELKLSTNVTKKTLENKILKSPPSLRPKKRKKMKTVNNKDIDIVMHECDKEPEFIIAVSNDNSSLKMSNSNPILITNDNDDKSCSSSIYNCPIGKNNTQHDDGLDSDNSMALIVSPKRRKLINSISRLSNQTKNLILNTNIIEKKNTSQQLNSTKDIQNQILNSLTEIKDEISNLKSKLILQHDTINGFDTFLTNTIEQTTIDGQSPNKSSITLEHIFPLESEEALEIFEKKIKCNTMFRNNVISRLSKLNNINGIGKSVECIMDKMFTVEVVSQYSVFGAKKKKNFSNLSTYRLLIDTIRLNHNKLDEKKINSALSIWLSFATFRSAFASTNNNVEINI